MNKAELISKLDKIKKVSNTQIEFAKKLGLSIEGLTESMAVAMIHDLISKEFWGKEIGTPTE